MRGGSDERTLEGEGGPVLKLPLPRTPDPRAAPVLRWGVLAPGRIAASFVSDLTAYTHQQVVAVGSRSQERAAEFARAHDIGRAYGSYVDLVADPNIDVVYVASPHSEHAELALLALAAGKPVLVEKAFARNAREAEQVLGFAREAGLFAMEAMWTRFLPHVDVVRQCLEQGMLGEVTSVLADHGQRLYPDGPPRLADPGLAGGALLDLGIYPVSFAHMVLGSFADVRAVGVLTPTGVDGQASIAVVNPSGAIGTLTSTMLARTPTTAAICGTRARLEIGSRFYRHGSAVTLVSPEGVELDRYRCAEPPTGLHFQAAEVARRIAAGDLESPLLLHAETVAILKTLDDVRHQLGVVFPGE